MIVREEQWDAAFLQSYRRLFSSLNRYAKATDMDTNIIMDEDDSFAILTRRFITEHEFFRWAGKQKESPRVQTKGKNLRPTDAYFTSLQTLYTMNEHLLAAAWRRDVGWGAGEDQELIRDTSVFKRFRPKDEDYLDRLYDELIMYWNGLLEVIPDLRKEPTAMRVHDLEAEDEDGATDHLLFWPIGQGLLAKVARRLLNKRLPDPRNPNKDAVVNALKDLGQVDWHLHQPPWRYLLLAYDPPPRNRWRMRSEDRKEALEVTERLLTWLVGIDELTAEDIEELKLDWRTRLIPAQELEHVNEMWETVTKKQVEITK